MKRNLIFFAAIMFVSCFFINESSAQHLDVSEINLKQFIGEYPGFEVDYIYELSRPTESCQVSIRPAKYIADAIEISLTKQNGKQAVVPDLYLTYNESIEKEGDIVTVYLSHLWPEKSCQFGCSYSNAKLYLKESIDSNGAKDFKLLRVEAGLPTETAQGQSYIGSCIVGFAQTTDFSFRTFNYSEKYSFKKAPNLSSVKSMELNLRKSALASCTKALENIPGKKDLCGVWSECFVPEQKAYELEYVQYPSDEWLNCRVYVSEVGL